MLTYPQDGFCELVKRPTLPLSSAMDNTGGAPTPAKPRKRKVAEIADSEDDLESDGDYGWIESDDAGLLAEEDENAAEDPDR